MRLTGITTRFEGSVFVGRTSDIDALRAALAGTHAGGPVVALVVGSSGMGKTALAERFLEELTGAIVLRGRCYEREAVPFKAFDDVVDALSRHLRRLPGVEAARLLPRNVHALTRVFPVLGRVQALSKMPQRTPLPADPHELRRRGFAALKELFGAIADAQPLVLFIDDLQWGDADSVLLLRDLVSLPDPPAMLVLGTYRDDEAAQSPFLTALHSDRARLENVDIRTLALAPFDDDEVTQLVEALGGGGAVNDAEAIAREAAAALIS